MEYSLTTWLGTTFEWFLEVWTPFELFDILYELPCYPGPQLEHGFPYEHSPTHILVLMAILQSELEKVVPNILEEHELTDFQWWAGDADTDDSHSVLDLLLVLDQIEN